jgi:hypothetical protein
MNGSSNNNEGSSSWAHKGVRMPPRDRIVNGVRIRAGGLQTGGLNNHQQESGDRAAAESVALRVKPIVGSNPSNGDESLTNDDGGGGFGVPGSARSNPMERSSHTPKSSRSSVLSRASAPVGHSSSNMIHAGPGLEAVNKEDGSLEKKSKNHIVEVEKHKVDTKSVTNLLKAVW